jgi:hypothetical protein
MAAVALEHENPGADLLDGKRNVVPALGQKPAPWCRPGERQGRPPGPARETCAGPGGLVGRWRLRGPAGGVTGRAPVFGENPGAGPSFGKRSSPWRSDRNPGAVPLARKGDHRPGARTEPAPWVGRGRDEADRVGGGPCGPPPPTPPYVPVGIRRFKRKQPVAHARGSDFGNLASEAIHSKPPRASLGRMHCATDLRRRTNAGYDGRIPVVSAPSVWLVSAAVSIASTANIGTGAVAIRPFPRKRSWSPPNDSRPPILV